MNTIPVDKGIPVPDHSNAGGHGQRVYPFTSMDVGDSFFVPYLGGRPDVLKSLRSLAPYYRNKQGVRFTVRKVDGGVRVWRIE
jgi:hypothetical protein